MCLVLKLMSWFRKLVPSAHAQIGGPCLGLFSRYVTCHLLYLCSQATNIWGSSSHQVILVTTSQPDVPLALSVLSSSYNSVTLGWQPGFDGGFQQFFRIRWQQAGREGYQFDDVFPQGAKQFEARVDILPTIRQL